MPEDRKRQGLALVRSVQDNLLVAGLRRMFPNGWYRPAAPPRAPADLIARLRVSTPSPRRLVKFLSGGNQQKVVIGKWLDAGSRLFIFDEPTRGIDVGAKAEIYHLMEQLVARGRGGADDQLRAARDRLGLRSRLRDARQDHRRRDCHARELSEESILRLAMHS